MSADKFSKPLQDHINKLYTDKNNKINLGSYQNMTPKEFFIAIRDRDKDTGRVKFDSKKIRSRLDAKDYHTASLTMEGMDNLAADIRNEFKNNKTVQDIFTAKTLYNTFAQYLKTQHLKPVTEAFTPFPKVTITDAGYIENVPQQRLRDIFIAFLAHECNLQIENPQLLKKLSAAIQTGHFAGIFFVKLKQALSATVTLANNAESYRDITVSIGGFEAKEDDKESKDNLNLITRMMKLLLDSDYLTSNIYNTQSIMAQAVKRSGGINPSVISELQFTGGNQYAGEVLLAAGSKLDAFIAANLSDVTGASATAFNDLVKSLKPVADLILLQAEKLSSGFDDKKLLEDIKKDTDYIKKLIESPGSLSFLQGIGANVASLIKTGKPSNVQVTKVKVQKSSKTKEDIGIKKATQHMIKTLSKLKSDLVKNNKKIKIKIKGTQIAARTISLVQLQNLINDSLVDRIKQNMGKGTDRKILNLRTGRLAESVKVERMSESREGMITAFYSYMKNPYATFSKGGRQENPPSRDPKLLIARSIRDIAAQKVSNRLRSVNV
jgi:hypothetical protein